MADATESATPVPPLQRLDAAGVAAVHDASMEIVESIGIQLDHERARQEFRERGATVEEDGVVTVPRDVIEEYVAKAPAQFVLHGRNPATDVTVGGEGPPVHAPGYGPANVRTYADGRRPALMADYERLLKLAQVEAVVTCTGYGLCEPTDVDPGVKHYETVARALELTDQPVMGPTYGADRAAACLDMVAIAVGDEGLVKPYVAGLVNTVPPRRIGEEMLGGLITYAEHGQPLVISSFTVAGASGPPSLAASLALTNAENLVGITLAQMVNGGTPVVYGTPTAAIDDRYGSLAIGGPEAANFAALGAQMAEYYELPSRAGGALTDAKTVDYQSGFESTFLQTVTRFADVDFVLNAMGILESYATISPEKFVLDCESIRYLDRFDGTVGIEEGDFRLEELAAVDPGGHFATDRSDHDRSRTPFYRADVADKRSFGAWSDDGDGAAFEVGADLVADRLAAYERPPLPDDRARMLEDYVESHR